MSIIDINEINAVVYAVIEWLITFVIIVLVILFIFHEPFRCEVISYVPRNLIGFVPDRLLVECLKVPLDFLIP